ncbi:MAG: HAD family hydrolase [Nanoarchaeota archaeon]
MKKGIIFDFDGTLVNSIHFHYRIHRKVFKEIGIDLTKEYFETKCNGTEPKEFYKRILLHFLKKDELFYKVWNKQKKYKMYSGLESIKIFSGVKTLLRKAKKEGYKLCVASSSNTNYVKKIMKSNGIEEYFDFIVGSEHFEHSKPNPAIFIEARKKIGLTKKECVIIEDSINGVMAAKRAGIDSICLLTSEKREDIPNYTTIAENHSRILEIIQKMN